ncbi:MAG: bifunctional hydroxymethylpyrimidine kinase/phosphomethylpyrimidine kinase [Bacteroidales bacterium]|nr:bifunctional hydroxymethylpyrimidine kinase/phosphomethylpyrimidine kinase [Bacteroidales bacterium]
MSEQFIPVLTIAGSDPSGGAGVQADLKTFMAHGCYGMSVITAVTAQNTRGVRGFEAVRPEMVVAQLRAVLEDIRPKAIKTGMLPDAETIKAITEVLREYPEIPLVVDPVLVATSGDSLHAEGTLEAIARNLFPISALITPNISEAKVFTGEDTPEKQAKKFHEMGARNVLLKGGDSTNNKMKTDVLSLNNGLAVTSLCAPAVASKNTHGTGCTLSAALASRLALGDTLAEAIAASKKYITEAISRAKDVKIGDGHGPVNHYIVNNQNTNVL